LKESVRDTKLLQNDCIGEPECQFIELDTSFMALHPYVYCVPMAIHANESFPLAIVAGLSESNELYA
jgi:hypothetical protein